MCSKINASKNSGDKDSRRFVRIISVIELNKKEYERYTCKSCDRMFFSLKHEHKQNITICIHTH